MSGSPKEIWITDRKSDMLEIRILYGGLLKIEKRGGFKRASMRCHSNQERVRLYTLKHGIRWRISKAEAQVQRFLRRTDRKLKIWGAKLVKRAKLRDALVMLGIEVLTANRPKTGSQHISAAATASGMCPKQNWHARGQGFLGRTDGNLEQQCAGLEFGFSYGEATEI